MPDERREDDLSLGALRQPRVIRAAPLRISVVGNLPGDKQIQMQTELSGATQEEIDGLLDDLVGRLERQTAKASLEQSEEALRKSAVALGTMISALPTAEKNFLAALEAIRAEMEEQSKAASEIRAGADKAWRDSGRGGEVELQGRAAQNMKIIAKANLASEAKAKKLHDERIAEVSQTLQNIVRAREDVAKQLEKVDDLRRISGREPLVDANIQTWLTCPLPEIGD